jgi:hypothetical protein
MVEMNVELVAINTEDVIPTGAGAQSTGPPTE